MKEEIIKQSILLFEKNGFSQTSIQDIVDGLGVTKGSFYYYFSSKEQLLMDIQLEHITNLLNRQKRIMENDKMSQQEKLTEMIRLLLTDIEERGPSGRVFYRELRHLGSENMKRIKEKRNQFRLNIEKIVEIGVENGEFRENLRADMITFGILGVTNWSYQWYNPAGEVSVDELTKIYTAMILHGIES